MASSTEKFDASGVQAKMKVIKGHFGLIGGSLDNANYMIDMGLSSPDEAMFGDGATKILATWDENSSSLQDFIKVFDDWSAMVVAMGNRYAELQEGTYIVKDTDGYNALSAAAIANRTTSLKTEGGAAGFSKAQENTNKSGLDKYGVPVTVEYKLENGKITKKETYDQEGMEGYYKELYYDPNQKKYVYKYCDKDGNEIGEKAFNDALSTNTKYAKGMINERKREIEELKAKIAEKKKHINGAEDQKELNDMEERLKKLESGEGLPFAVQKMYTGELPDKYNGLSIEYDDNGNIVAAYDDKGISLSETGLSELSKNIGVPLASAISSTGDTNASSIDTTAEGNTNDSSISEPIEKTTSTGYTLTTDKNGNTIVTDEEGNKITDEEIIAKAVSGENPTTTIRVGNTTYTVQEGGQVIVSSSRSDSFSSTSKTTTYDKNGDIISSTESRSDITGYKYSKTVDNDGKETVVETKHNKKGETTTTINEYDGDQLVSTTVTQGRKTTKTEYYDNGNKKYENETDINGEPKTMREFTEDGKKSKVIHYDSKCHSKYEYNEDGTYKYETYSGTDPDNNKQKLHEVEYNKSDEKIVERYYEDNKKSVVIHYEKDKDCHSIYDKDGKSYTTYAGTDPGVKDENKKLRRVEFSNNEGTEYKEVVDYETIDGQLLTAQRRKINLNDHSERVTEYNNNLDQPYSVVYKVDSDGNKSDAAIQAGSTTKKIENSDAFFAARDYAKENGYKEVPYRNAYRGCDVYNSDSTMTDVLENVLFMKPTGVEEKDFYVFADRINSTFAWSPTDNASAICYIYDQNTGLYKNGDGLIYEPNREVIYYDPNMYDINYFGITKKTH